MKIRLFLLCAMVIGLCVSNVPMTASAEPPEYEQLRDSGDAGRWEENQYKRADQFDQRGEHEKANEIRGYAKDRVDMGKEAGDMYREEFGTGKDRGK